LIGNTSRADCGRSSPRAPEAPGSRACRPFAFSGWLRDRQLSMIMALPAGAASDERLLPGGLRSVAGNASASPGGAGVLCLSPDRGGALFQVAGLIHHQHRKYKGLTCAVEGCERQPKVRGSCNMHFQRWVRAGDPVGKWARILARARVTSTLRATSSVGTVRTTSWSTARSWKRSSAVHCKAPRTRTTRTGFAPTSDRRTWSCGEATAAEPAGRPPSGVRGQPLSGAGAQTAR
jgi:hypothetical protein